MNNEKEDLLLEALERLEIKLSKKQREIHDLKRELKLRDSYFWPAPKTEKENLDLPTPRLEFREEDLTKRGGTVSLWLILGIDNEEQESICIGSTTSSHPPKDPWIPLRDGARALSFSKTNNWPIYLTFKNRLYKVSFSETWDFEFLRELG